VIIGDGPQRSQLESLARSENCRCEFLGVQPPERVKELMARASVLSVPSVTAANGDTEGLPLVVCEAQSMALPVAGFHHAGIPEAVAHGVTGLLCPERQVAALAENLACLLADRTLRERFGRDARQRMCERFDLATQTARLELIYQATSKRRRGLRPATHLL
jgi:glycosyltransferase involved in cell wall biosynthesis